jgi:aryl-alcohol dehydrogenase-like predicted oxidoreductase
LTTFTKRTINGRAVNPVGLGCMNICWAYGPPVADDYAMTLLNAALDKGYDHLDTARIYGDGKSETLIGQALKHRRHEYFLASKTGIFVDGQARRIDCRPESIKAACETSLKLLQTDYIDLYYLHRRDFNTPIEESVGALAELVKEGKIGSYGLSEMSAETLRRAHAIHPCAAMQTEYSPMTRDPEIAVLDACKELGVTFVAFSPVGRGLLAGGLKAGQAWAKGDLRAAWPRFQEPHYSANLDLVAAYKAIATEAGVTPSQLSMGWVLAKGDHIVTIPGSQNIAHVEENIARWDWVPDAATIAKIDALINRETVAGERYTPGMQKMIDTEVFEVA